MLYIKYFGIAGREKEVRFIIKNTILQQSNGIKHFDLIFFSIRAIIKTIIKAIIILITMDIIVVHNKVEIYSFVTPIKLPFGKLTNSSYSNFKIPIISPKQNMQVRLYIIF